MHLLPFKRLRSGQHAPLDRTPSGAFFTPTFAAGGYSGSLSHPQRRWSDRPPRTIVASPMSCSGDVGEPVYRSGIGSVCLEQAHASEDLPCGPALRI